jgi:hypothetical protein
LAPWLALATAAHRHRFRCRCGDRDARGTRAAGTATTTNRPLPNRSWERLRAVLAKETASGAATAASIGGTERCAVEAFAFLGDVDG